MRWFESVGWALSIPDLAWGLLLGLLWFHIGYRFGKTKGWGFGMVFLPPKSPLVGAELRKKIVAGYRPARLSDRRDK